MKILKFNESKNINQVDDIDGSTPLINAVINQKLEKIKKLINAGADLNIQDDCGYSALMWAVLEDEGEKKYKILSEILKAEPDLELSDTEDMNFWNMASAKCQEFMYNNFENVKMYIDAKKYNV